MRKLRIAASGCRDVTQVNNNSGRRSPAPKAEPDPRGVKMTGHSSCRAGTRRAVAPPPEQATLTGKYFENRLEKSLAKFAAVFFGALLSIIIVASPALAQAPPGSYLQSCGGIRFDGYTLSAFCQGPGGQSFPSRLAVGNCRGDIANINGQLVCAGGGGRPYGGPPPQYGGGPPPPYGGPPPQYGGPPPQYGGPPPQYGGPPPQYGGPPPQYGGGFGLPGGSWRASCGNPMMRGPILFADCRRGDGAMQPARGDTRACRRFANFNGQLVCE